MTLAAGGPPPAPDGGLWRHREFVRLWAAQTVSVFGSMITGSAIPFMAVLLLDASAVEVALLSASGIAPGLVAGLPAGVWLDRVARRPVMIAADLGRAALLATVPLAYAFDALVIEQLYVVAFCAGVLTTFFDIAYRSYLPAIVTQDELLEGNSKLTASGAVSEFAGFSVSGWLVQLVSGPVTLLIDAVTFAISALFLRSIKTPEPRRVTDGDEASMYTEAAAGFRAVGRDPVLRAIAASLAIHSFCFGMFAIYTLFTIRTLHFQPAALGVIYGIGGLSSLAGAVLASRAARRFGVGPSMVLGLLAMGCSMSVTPAIPAIVPVAAVLLIGQQLFGDGLYTIYEVNQVSLRQSITPPDMMGRVNAFMRVTELGFLLAGTLSVGFLASAFGVRPALALGGAGVIASGLLLGLSPVRRLRGTAGDANPFVLQPEEAARTLF